MTTTNRNAARATDTTATLWDTYRAASDEALRASLALQYAENDGETADVIAALAAELRASRVAQDAASEALRVARMMRRTEHDAAVNGW